MVVIRAIATVLCISLSAIQALNEPCSSNSDCLDAYRVCKDRVCQCNPISYANGSRCIQYVTEYNGYCELDEQCSKFLGANSICKRAGCICSEGHVWYKGKCQAYANKGQPCDQNTICYDKNDLTALICPFVTCTCNIGHYDRGPDCRKRHVWFENSCVLNADCKDEKICIKGKCTKKSIKEERIDHSFGNEKVQSVITLTEENISKHASGENKVQTVNGKPATLSSRYELPTLYCDMDSDCKTISNSQCDIKSNKCRCIDNTYYLDGDCLPGLGPCTENEKCTDKNKNSMCFQSTTCICKQGYFLRNGECIAELGMTDPNIKSVADCKIKPAFFEWNTCYCANYWFTSEDKRNCIKTTTQEFQSCMENSWCDAMGPYSYCENNKCKCSSFAKLDETKFYCDKISQPTKSECSRDNDCDKDQHCQANQCHCLDGFIRDSNGRCLSDFGTSCIQNECHGKYLCIDGKCGCHNNYVGVDGACWKVADNLNETCTYKEQCRNIEFSDCQLLSANGMDKTCSCVDGYTDYEGNTCIKSKKYGDVCMSAADCTKVINKSFQCRNSICQCPLNQKLINGYCKSAASLRQISHLGVLLAVLSIWVFI